MTATDNEGRRSHVRSSERPSVVLVQSSVPNSSRQPKMRECVRVGCGPNSDNPSFVFLEWIDAWLSFSNTCSELTAHGRQERLHAKRKVSQQGIGINLHGLVPLCDVMHVR